MHDDRSPDQLETLLTEQTNAATHHIDKMSPLEIAQAMNAEDAVVAAAVALETPHIAQAIEAIAARMRSGGRMIYIGAGTSGRLGALDAYECPPTFNVAPDRVIACVAGGALALSQAAEDLEDDALAGERDILAVHISAQDCVIGVTASGRTPYVLGGVACAKNYHALTIGLVCNAPSRLANLADICIAPIVGPEVISGSTRLKAGTAQKMVLNMMSTGVMILLGKTYGNLMVDVQATNDKLRKRAMNVVRAITGCDEAVAEQALQQAQGDTRTAVVMIVFQEDAATAGARLMARGGNLRAALERGL